MYLGCPIYISEIRISIYQMSYLYIGDQNYRISDVVYIYISEIRISAYRMSYLYIGDQN